MESSGTTINDLPEDILLRILTFLPTTTTVKTSAVARRWRNLWYSVPILDFCMFQFYRHSWDRSIRDTRQLFAEFISQTLLRRPSHSPLEKFRVFFDYANYDFMRAYVNSWVRYAIESKTTEIELDFDFDFAIYLWFKFGKRGEDGIGWAIEDPNENIYLSYEFHFSHLINSSVKVLTLRGCNFCLPSSDPAIKFDSMREIHLQACHFTDEEIQLLMALCANVESLSLDIFWDVQNLKIVSSKLKRLELGVAHWDDSDQSSVEICAPNLTSVRFNGFYAKKYMMSDTSALVEACATFDKRGWRDFAYWTNVVSLLSSVERLTIQNMWMWLAALLENVKEPEDDSEEELADIEEGYDDPEAGSDGEVVNGEEEEYHEQEAENDEEMVIGGGEYHGKHFGEGVFSRNFAFNNLKYLELLTGYTIYDLLGLQFLLETCPKLETLVLNYSYFVNNEDLEEEIRKRPIVLKMPSLKLIKMMNYTGSKNELCVVGLLNRGGLILEKIEDGASS